MHRTAELIGLIAAMLGVLGPTVAALRAQVPRQGGVLRISRTPRPPVIEEFVAGDPPDSMRPISDFRQFEPGDGVPVSDSTTAYLSYDDANLYVVFVCRSDPRQVRAGLAKREDIVVDDGVAVYLDTFHDRTHAYRFQVNPLGVQLDGMVTEGQDDDFSFDAVWQSDGRLTPSGYVVRFAIPFKSLRFPRTPTQTWGIALARYIPRTNEEAYWPYLTKRVSGFVPQFATLQGLTDISPGRNLQAIPYGTFAGARYLDTEAPAFRTANDHRLGLDFKAVLRDALTLDATANPDFSQVESDEPQVTINERFETFYPEKRPFFIENAGYFQTPVNLFFSRRIADPGMGLRMTGKAGRWALGAIGIDDRAPGELPTGEAAGGPRAGVGAFRLQRLIGRESSLGVLASDWTLAGGWNRVASADARLRLSKTWTFAGQAIATAAVDSSGSRSSGTGFSAQLVRDGRNFDYEATYLDLSSAFDDELGYVPRVGIRQLEQSLELVTRPSGAVVKVGPTLSTSFDWDRDGLLLDRELEAAFEVKLVGETQLELKRKQIFERFHDLPFDTYESEVSLESQWFPWLALASKVKVGTAVNHKPAAGLEPFLGNVVEGELDFTFRPIPRLRLDHTFLYERLTTRPGPAPAPARWVYTDRILREKVNYQFSRPLSLRAIVDYSTVRRDSTLSRLDPERRWSVDLLLTYLLNPGTALYVGYRDGYENLAILPGTPPTLSRIDDPTTSVGRQLFLKMSYLLQF
ncbi:MAG TPA: DUF5916 domain-containing protein [Gemmatimonadales bacterium]|nr:DUF5916 domain-containing protein [Gemmatimonadales bacterium]